MSAFDISLSSEDTGNLYDDDVNIDLRSYTGVGSVAFPDYPFLSTASPFSPAMAKNPELYYVVAGVLAFAVVGYVIVNKGKR